MFAYLSPIESLRPLAPVPFEIAFGRDTKLPGDQTHDAFGYLASPLGKAAIELKGFQQNRKVEPGGPALAKQSMLIWGQQPMPEQFVRVPILFQYI